MANKVSNKPLLVFLGGLSLSLVFVLGVAQTGEADKEGYREGFQYLYPYYVPQETPQAFNIFEELDFQPQPDQPALAQVQAYAQKQLGLNDLGSLVLSTGLNHFSQLDAAFHKDGACGIAVWPCDGQRWQRLLNFSQLHNLDHTELPTQLLFIHLELNQFDNSATGYGAYQNVYNILKEAENFASASTVLIQNYLNQAPIDLTQMAQTIHNYEPEIFTPAPEPAPELEPEVEPAPALEPTTIPPSLPPNPEPEPEPLAPTPRPLRYQPSTVDCRAGIPTTTSYIPLATDSDSQGRLLETLTIIKSHNPQQLTTTYIHRCLQESITKMLAAYNAAQTKPEYKLGGWGWRSQAAQIELRKQHCGTTQYDIWEKPASQCSPPTARPGLSSHQDGLAIDFFCQTTTLTKTNCNQAFEWLNCQAANYGLINLSGEAWHWYFPLHKPEKLLAKQAQGC